MESSPGARALRALRLLVALFGVLGLAALTPQLASADTPGTISGTVTDSGGTTIVGAEVQAYNLDAGGYYTVYTTSNGTYSLGNLPTGHYQVEFRPTNGQNYVYQYYPDKPNPAAAQPVLVTSGQTTQGINASLATGATISGRVMDAITHAGVSPADVTIRDYGGGYPGFIWNSTVETDSNGNWSITGIPTGTYQIQFVPFSPSIYASQYYNDANGQDPPTPVELTAGQTKSGIDGALITGGQISGTVTDGITHSGAAGIYVLALDASGSQSSYATTDSNGRYTLTGLSPSASYRVLFSPPQGSPLATEFYPSGATLKAATPVPVTIGQSTPNIDETLGEGASISGVVTNAATGFPIESVPVTLTDATGQEVFDFAGYTQPDGTYDITNLPPGSYKVRFSSGGSLAFQYYNDVSTPSAASSMTLSAGQAATSINAALAAGGTLEGTVTDASTGEAVPDAYVAVMDASGNSLATGFTDASGHYEVSGIAPGSYYVEAIVLAGNPFFGTTVGARVQFYGGAGALSSAAPVTITARQTTAGIDIALAPNAAGSHASTTSIPAIPVVLTPPTPTPPVGGSTTLTPGAPRLFAASLSGLAKGKPVVRFRLASGSNGAPKLRSFKVKLPAGLAFVAAQLRKGVKVTGGGRVTEKVIGGQLVVTLGSPASAVAVSITAPALKVTGQLSANAASRRAGKLRVIVTVTPMNQGGQTLSFTVKNPN